MRTYETYREYANLSACLEWIRNRRKFPISVSHFATRTTRRERSCLIARLTERYLQCISRLLSANCAHNFYLVAVRSQSTPSKMYHYLDGERYIQITRNRTQSHKMERPLAFVRDTHVRGFEICEISRFARDKTRQLFKLARPRPPKSHLRL